MKRLRGKRALVTGAGGAIATAICEKFAAEGAAVFCVDIDGDAALRTAARIVEAGGQASARPCDVSDEAQVRDTVRGAAAAMSGLDVVVNTAATATAVGTVAEMSLDDWQREISVNLTGVFLVCKYAFPEIKAAGGGSIVNIASQLGTVVVRKRPGYVTSKAAVIQLSKSMAIDFAADNIRVNSLSPGAVETGRLLVGHGTMEMARERLVPLHPIGRLGRPMEIAEAALFLAGDEARFMTGADLIVDGAYTAV